MWGLMSSLSGPRDQVLDLGVGLERHHHRPGVSLAAERRLVAGGLAVRRPVIVLRLGRGGVGRREQRDGKPWQAKQRGGSTDHAAAPINPRASVRARAKRYEIHGPTPGSAPRPASVARASDRRGYFRRAAVGAATSGARRSAAAARRTAG